jgi:hypothetical protein
MQALVRRVEDRLAAAEVIDVVVGIWLTRFL